MVGFDLLQALRHLAAGDKKKKPAFKNEREAYNFLRKLYNQTGGVTPELRRTYEFYQKQSVENCEPVSGPHATAGSAGRR